MHLKNITDNDIQDYLDGNLNPLHREYIETAMANNPAVAERIGEYRLVQSALKKEEKPLDSREFVDAVMTRIDGMTLDPAAPRWRALDWLPLSAAVALVLGLVYLVGPDSILGLFSELPTIDFTWAGSFVEKVEQTIEAYGDLLPYVGFSTAAALLYSLLDRVFVLSRYERIHS